MAEKIRYQLDVSRVLEVLTSQIYNSPYALLQRIYKTHTMRF